MARPRLTAVQVAEIRSRCAAGEYQRIVGDAFGVSLGTVNGIMNGHTHVGAKIGRPPVPAIDRFWSHVALGGADDCWLWSPTPASRPYAKLRDDAGRTVDAHVFSYRIHRGPTNGLCVCHTCDTPLCMNPAHYFLGTLADNNHDRHAKGRTFTGPRPRREDGRPVGSEV